MHLPSIETFSLSLWSKCAMFFICFILTEQPTRRNQIKEVDQNEKNTFEKTLSRKKLTSLFQFVFGVKNVLQRKQKPFSLIQFYCSWRLKFYACKKIVHKSSSTKLKSFETDWKIDRLEINVSVSVCLKSVFFFLISIQRQDRHVQKTSLDPLSQHCPSGSPHPSKYGCWVPLEKIPKYSFLLPLSLLQISMKKSKGLML